MCFRFFDHDQWSPTEPSYELSYSYGTAGGLTMELVMKWHSWGSSLHWERSSLSWNIVSKCIMFPATWPLWGYIWVDHGPWYTMVYPLCRHIHFLMLIYVDSKQQNQPWCFLNLSEDRRASACRCRWCRSHRPSLKYASQIFFPYFNYKDSWIGSE